MALEMQNPPRSSGRVLFDSFELGGCVHGVAGLVEGVLDLGAQESQDADNDKSDERDEQAVLDEGLALFFLQKLFDHDECVKTILW